MVLEAMLGAVSFGGLTYLAITTSPQGIDRSAQKWVWVTLGSGLAVIVMDRQMMPPGVVLAVFVGVVVAAELARQRRRSTKAPGKIPLPWGEYGFLAFLLFVLHAALARWAVGVSHPAASDGTIQGSVRWLLDSGFNQAPVLAGSLMTTGLLTRASSLRLIATG